MRKTQLGAAVILATTCLFADQSGYTVRMLPLPGASDAGIYLDYIAYDPHNGVVWVPAGKHGRGRCDRREDR